LVTTFRHQLKELAQKGIDTGYVSKVKKAWVEKHRVDIKKNEYWLSALDDIYQGEKTTDRIINAEKYYNAFGVEDVKKAANLLLNSKGKMIAVQLPEVVKEKKEKTTDTKGF
jgi:zinc protease